jgi:hypothetical protein
MHQQATSLYNKTSLPVATEPLVVAGSCVNDALLFEHKEWL